MPYFIDSVQKGHVNFLSLCPVFEYLSANTLRQLWHHGHTYLLGTTLILFGLTASACFLTSASGLSTSTCTSTSASASATTDASDSLSPSEKNSEALERSSAAWEDEDIMRNVRMIWGCCEECEDDMRMLWGMWGCYEEYEDVMRMWGRFMWGRWGMLLDQCKFDCEEGEDEFYHEDDVRKVCLRGRWGRCPRLRYPSLQQLLC